MALAAISILHAARVSLGALGAAGVDTRQARAEVVAGSWRERPCQRAAEAAKLEAGRGLGLGSPQVSGERGCVILGTSEEDCVGGGSEKFGKEPAAARRDEKLLLLLFRGSMAADLGAFQR